MNSKLEKLSNTFADHCARSATAVCLLLSGVNAVALPPPDNKADTSFTGKVTAAKTANTAAKTTVEGAINSTVDIITMLAALAGFLFFLYGIFWVMSASRSEGRKEASPGWIMIIGGGILGVAASVYYLVVSGAAGIAPQT